MKKKSFHDKAMRIVFGEHLQELLDVWSYPKAGRGAFGPKTDKYPI